MREEMSEKYSLPLGFSCYGLHAGIKKGKRPDLAIIFSKYKAKTCAMFTKNKVLAAPIIYDKEVLKRNNLCQAVVVNSGCANACTGEDGIKNAERVASVASKLLNIPKSAVLVASTGVIGKQLPVEKVVSGLKKITSILKSSKIDAHQQVLSVANAILTTDTCLKVKTAKFSLPDATITLTGIAKGAGMIHPELASATFLCFLMCDINISTVLLKSALKDVIEETFHRITVDGETSTNDTVILMANGAAGNKIIALKNKMFTKFYQNLYTVCLQLAKMIAFDGEGKTKNVTITIKGIKEEKIAAMIGRKIATSPLVKTAIFGSDPNWGRIAASIGQVGRCLPTTNFDIYINEIKVAANSAPAQYDERLLRRKLKNSVDVNIVVEFKKYPSAKPVTIYTCDLTYDYIKINSAYTS
jgi:glutamate N-acetyltransferase/amino-acid N-acetyltransferase